MQARCVVLVTASIIAAAIGAAPDARAQSEARTLRWSEPAQSTAPSPPAPVTDTQWYGWQTILVDGAALGTMALGAASQSSVVGTAGIGLYALGPPMVHAAHGRPDALLGDLGIRVGAPLLFGAIGYAIDYATTQCPPEQPGKLFSGLCFRGLGGAVIGTFAGYVTAVILDSAWLAREPVSKKSDSRDAARLRWTPTVSITPTGGSAGVGGIF